MNPRNLSPQQMFENMAREHKPLCAFTGGDFASWKQDAMPRVMATLGDFPQRVEPNPQLLAEWEHDGLRKQRWIIDVGPQISATLLVNYPKDMGAGEKRGALLCW